MTGQGRGRVQIKGDNEVGGIIRGDDRQRLVPHALVSVLTVLIDELDDATPSATRAELRAIRSAMCRAFRLPDPQGRGSTVEVEQDLAEIDGIPVED